MLWIFSTLLSLSLCLLYYWTKNLEYIKITGLFLICVLMAFHISDWRTVYSDNLSQAKRNKHKKNKRLQENTKSWLFGLDDLYKTLNSRDEEEDYP